MLVNTTGCHYLWFDDNGNNQKAIGSFDLFVRNKDENVRMELWSFGIIGKANRGRGYGQKMLREAMSLADGKPIRLYVHKSNDVAIHVYQKAGFHIIGKYMGDEAWVMQYDGDINEQCISNVENRKEATVC